MVDSDDSLGSGNISEDIERDPLLSNAFRLRVRRNYEATWGFLDEENELMLRILYICPAIPDQEFVITSYEHWVSVRKNFLSHWSEEKLKEKRERVLLGLDPWEDDRQTTHVITPDAYNDEFQAGMVADRKPARLEVTCVPESETQYIPEDARVLLDSVHSDIADRLGLPRRDHARSLPSDWDVHAELVADKSRQEKWPQDAIGFDRRCIRPVSGFVISVTYLRLRREWKVASFEEWRRLSRGLVGRLLASYERNRRVS